MGISIHLIPECSSCTTWTSTLLIAAKGSRSPSLIVFRLRNMRPENVLAYLRKTHVKSREAAIGPANQLGQRDSRLTAD
jgi:hypothetical protein